MAATNTPKQKIQIAGIEALQGIVEGLQEGFVQKSDLEFEEISKEQVKEMFAKGTVANGEQQES